MKQSVEKSIDLLSETLPTCRIMLTRLREVIFEGHNARLRYLMTKYFAKPSIVIFHLVFRHHFRQSRNRHDTTYALSGGAVPVLVGREEGILLYFRLAYAVMDDS